MAGVVDQPLRPVDQPFVAGALGSHRTGRHVGAMVALAEGKGEVAVAPQQFGDRSPLIVRTPQPHREAGQEVGAEGDGRRQVSPGQDTADGEALLERAQLAAERLGHEVLGDAPRVGGVAQLVREGAHPVRLDARTKGSGALVVHGVAQRLFKRLGRSQHGTS
jgi:hypothetical protein